MRGGEDEESSKSKSKSKSQIAQEICELITTNKFINWYLVLRVDENADAECIKKQYHKLALLVHPDKNKDSKAGTAFNLVSQAYVCLSDEAKRAAFDAARNPVVVSHKCTNGNNNTSSRFDQQARVKRRIKELRSKLEDEATVIQKCLTPKGYTNAASETPVFNPSDYHQNGYPHYTPTSYKMQPRFGTGNRCFDDAPKTSYPVFQYRHGFRS